MIEVVEVIVKKQDLEKICKKYGITIRKLCIMSKCSYNYVNDCINGRRRMTNEYWNRLTMPLKD